MAGMRAFFAHVVALPYNPKVATVWGEIQAHGQLRGRTRPANDTWIAASCLARQLPLATFRPQGFRRSRRAREAGDRTDPVTSNEGLVDDEAG